jgi:hypothetical protein
MTYWKPPPPRAPLLAPAHAATAAAVGFLFSAVLAWLSTALIGNAWAECDILGAGGRGALLILWFPGIWSGAAAAFFFGAWAVRRSPALVGIVVGAILAMAVGGIAIALSVPIHGESFWVGWTGPEANFSGTAQCGLGGIPTWWPIWLPH